jgi:predicted transposase YbfD/YdcC
MNILSGKPQKIALFLELILPLKDYRRITKGNIRHSIQEIFFLTLSAAISGCNTWELIEEFGKLKLDWFRNYFPYKYKTPSHDTLGRFFSAFDRDEFAKFFMDFTQKLATKDSRVVSIDGKTIRGVNSEFGNNPLHIVSAFCTNNKITLCQEKVNDKSNEITAIPVLLDLLDLQDCVVTIDAMGCQKAIAEKIIERKGDYILQVKDNQKDLKEQIEKLFKRQTSYDKHVGQEVDHGRIEKRTCSVINELGFLDGKEEWKSLKTIVSVETEIIHKKTQKKSINTNFFISSSTSNAKQMAKDIRGHWAIENNLHWNLDVIFKEDLQLKRKGNSSENFNMIIKLALGLLDGETSTKKSKTKKRLIASIDDSYRELVLKI